jgi:hypothetical protein
MAESTERIRAARRREHERGWGGVRSRAFLFAPPNPDEIPKKKSTAISGTYGVYGYLRGFLWITSIRWRHRLFGCSASSPRHVLSRRPRVSPLKTTHIPGRPVNRRINYAFRPRDALRGPVRTPPPHPNPRSPHHSAGPAETGGPMGQAESAARLRQRPRPDGAAESVSPRRSPRSRSRGCPRPQQAEG